jgi:hypothetical protein
MIGTAKGEKNLFFSSFFPEPGVGVLGSGLFTAVVQSARWDYNFPY